MSREEERAPLVTYAQNFEDVMLWRALKNIGAGFYIDIGAQDPVIDSVSLAFYEQGWRGVHVEPVPAYAEALRRARPDETVLQAAVGRPGGIVRFFEIPGTGLSTEDPDMAETHRLSGFGVREVEVPCMPLAGILDRYADREVHWMKIDVEGAERDVLESWEPSAVRPWVVVVESTVPRTETDVHGAWEKILERLGYRFAYFDGLNRFYLSCRHEDLADHFRCGPNLFDPFTLSETGRSPFSGGLARSLEAERAETRRLGEEIQSIRVEVEELRASLAAKSEEVGKSQEEVQRLRRDLEGKEREISLVVGFAEDRARRLAETDRRLGEGQAEARRREQELEEGVRIAEDKVRHLVRDLEVVYASHSWRLTAPVRLVGDLLKGLPKPAGPGEAPPWVSGRWTRRVVASLVGILRAHPRLWTHLVRLAARRPGLTRRLHRLLQEPVPRANRSTSMSLKTGAIDWTDHPAAVRRAYVQLMQAVDEGGARRHADRP